MFPATRGPSCVMGVPQTCRQRRTTGASPLASLLNSGWSGRRPTTFCKRCTSMFTVRISDLLALGPLFIVPKAQRESSLRFYHLEGHHSSQQETIRKVLHYAFFFSMPAAYDAMRESGHSCTRIAPPPCGKPPVQAQVSDAKAYINQEERNNRHYRKYIRYREQAVPFVINNKIKKALRRRPAVAIDQSRQLEDLRNRKEISLSHVEMVISSIWKRIHVKI